MAGVTYAGSGVDYEKLDSFKIACQKAAKRTSQNAKRFGVEEIPWSRGESACLMEHVLKAWPRFLSLVEEGLGTKNLVADAMYQLTGKSYYDQIAQDAVAMIVNDMITVGALPLMIAMHIAAGSDDWFKDDKRANDFIEGWAHACHLARCVWCGGETPALKDVIMPNAVVISGSATGVVPYKLIGDTYSQVRENDLIVFIQSSGIHANGLSSARKIAAQLPEGYLTKLPDGRTFGETLLDPTPIYVRFMEEILKLGIDIHYAVNITGHGWRKLMRAKTLLPVSYVIEKLPPPLPIFEFLQKTGEMSDREMYGNFNMGAGFALYVSEDAAERVILEAEQFGHKAFVAGYVGSGGGKKVVIKPKNIVFEGEELAIRA